MKVNSLKAYSHTLTHTHSNTITSFCLHFHICQPAGKRISLFHTHTTRAADEFKPSSRVQTLICCANSPCVTLFELSVQTHTLILATFSAKSGTIEDARVCTKSNQLRLWRPMQMNKLKLHLFLPPLKPTASCATATCFVVLPTSNYRVAFNQSVCVCVCSNTSDNRVTS